MSKRVVVDAEKLDKLIARLMEFEDHLAEAIVANNEVARVTSTAEINGYLSPIPATPLIEAAKAEIQFQCTECGGAEHLDCGEPCAPPCSKCQVNTMKKALRDIEGDK